MDYRERAKDLLGRKKSLISAYSAITMELESLQKERNVCKSLIANGEGEDTLLEDKLINILADLDDCRFRRGIVERELCRIEKGMNGLNDYEKDLINNFFVESYHGVTEDLMLKWYKERSTLYRDRTRALDKFTRSVYGILQI